MGWVVGKRGCGIAEWLVRVLVWVAWRGGEMRGRRGGGRVVVMLSGLPLSRPGFFFVNVFRGFMCTCTCVRACTYAMVSADSGHVRVCVCVCACVSASLRSFASDSEREREREGERERERETHTHTHPYSDAYRSHLDACIRESRWTDSGEPCAFPFKYCPGGCSDTNDPGACAFPALHTHAHKPTIVASQPCVYTNINPKPSSPEPKALSPEPQPHVEDT